MRKTRNQDALFIVTEQACYFAKAQDMESKNFRLFRTAAECLANGYPEAMEKFHERTKAVPTNPDGSADYEIEEYEGQEIDAYNAIATLLYLSHAEGMTESTKADLINAVEVIADFYDLCIFTEPIPA